MPYKAVRPVLIVEGHGDIVAVPDLVRRVADHRHLFEMRPVSPAIRQASVAGFKNAERLGKFVRLAALREDADSILIALDCDDGCAKEEVYALSERLVPLAVETGRKIGICLFVKEFEALFLHCLEELSAGNPSLRIQLPCPIAPHEIENVRAAKGVLNQQMQGSSYKETRDQQKFVHHLNIEKLIVQSRSLRHLSTCLDFLMSEGTDMVYPLKP